MTSPESLNSGSRLFSRRPTAVVAVTVVALLSPQAARADESGISYWLPGLYGSMSATPTTPGAVAGAILGSTTGVEAGAAAAGRTGSAEADGVGADAAGWA